MHLDRRSLWLIWLLGVLFCGLWFPAQVHAEAPVTILASEHSYVFGEQVRFHLQAEGDAPIESIVLSYRTSDVQDTNVVVLSFGAATTVDIEHVHQISERYVRPFVEITYWWTISDANGAKLTTDPQSFEYVDDRFTWQSLSEGGAVVYWYEGEVEVAGQALDVAGEAISRAVLDVPVEALQKTIDIYLYAHPDDLRLTLPAGLPAGADALTLHETNVILVPYGPKEANIPALQRILPHEVAHALIHEATRNHYDRVPPWLAEGLATSVEYTFVPDPEAQALLDAALERGEPFRLEVLCGEFPHTGQDARLAYAQSASVVATIRDLYGREALRDLTRAYADGATCEGGVQRVFGVSLERLELLWREYQAPQGQLSLFWEYNASQVVLVLLLSAPVLFLLPWAHWFHRTPERELE